jgi:hypothetical protein
MTTASKNIEAVFSKAGATATHTPGYATKRSEETEASEAASMTAAADPKGTEGTRQFEGIGTSKHEERFGDQLPEVSYNQSARRSNCHLYLSLAYTVSQV